jgi:hypothetical protein
MPQPLEEQRRSNPPTPCIGRGFVLDQRQHHRTLRQPGNGARQTVEITARNDHFLAPEIGDDALLGATVLADVLDQVDVGVGANALVAGEHALSISDSSPQSINIDQLLPEFSTALSARLCQPPAFPPFSMAKSGPAVQVGSDAARRLRRRQRGRCQNHGCG